jgi:hypothetical protein
VRVGTGGFFCQSIIGWSFECPGQFSMSVNAWFRQFSVEEAHKLLLDSGTLESTCLAENSDLKLDTSLAPALETN